MDRQGQVDFHSGGRHNSEPSQKRGRGQVVTHPAPPMTSTVSAAMPMFPAIILATLACARTPDFCPEVPPMK